MTALTDREIFLSDKSSDFESKCALARLLGQRGYLVTLTDVNGWSDPDFGTVVDFIEFDKEPPAFLSRYEETQEDTDMAPKKKTEKTKKPKGSSAPKADAEAAKTRPDTKVERFKSRLRVVLPKDAVAERADRMAHVIGERENLVAQAKAATTHLKAQIKEKDAEIGALSAQIRDKAEYAEVECERRHHYRTGKIVEVRLDTEETTFERAMTFSERQLELPAKRAAEPKKALEEAALEAEDEAPDQPATDEPPESTEEVDEEEESPESGETGDEDGEEGAAE